jgi:5-methylcytosine-specific restriction endonuclease McrA
MTLFCVMCDEPIEYRGGRKPKSHRGSCRREYKRQYDSDYQSRPDIRANIRTRQNGDKARATQRRWCKANPVKELARHRRSGEKKKAKRAAMTDEEIAAYRKKNREYQKRLYHTDPVYREKVLMRSKLRQSRRRATWDGTVTLSSISALFEAFGSKCLRCGCAGPLTIDHIIPVSKGGIDSLGNIQPLCRSCNSWKSTKTVDFRPGGICPI